MDVSKAIEVRRSIRKYKDTLVEDEKLNKILESAKFPHQQPTVRNGNLWLLRIKTQE